MPRPSVACMAEFSDWLEAALDAEAAAHPNPGRPGVHRLNRTEDSNAIRDIFALDVNAGSGSRWMIRAMDSTTLGTCFRLPPPRLIAICRSAAK